jgi:hypothetical protein
VAPERITVTVDRYGEPIVFGADLTERARANDCAVVDYVRADLAEAPVKLLREIRNGKHSLPGTIVQIDRLLIELGAHPAQDHQQ